MTMPGSDDLIKAVGANIQEKASLIWSVADALRGPCKPHEYGPAILPMTVIKRFRDRLLPAHGAVLAIMDMGSAVMTVKMVLEDLDDDQVQMLDCPFVEGTVEATVLAQSGSSIAEIKGAIAADTGARKF